MEGPYVQEMPEGKIILACAQKESSLGMLAHQRLLFFNGKDKVIGYCNQFPQELPLKSFRELELPKKIGFVD